MKIYIKDNIRSTYKVDDTWEEIYKSYWSDTFIYEDRKNEDLIKSYKKLIELYLNNLLRIL